MSGEAGFEDINEAKENMDYIYDQPDPRAYFRELNKLDYAIPDTAKPIIQKLIGHLQQRQNDTVHVLDLGCSYGINAAILKYDLSMDELYEHWGQNKMVGATSEEVVAYDQQCTHLQCPVVPAVAEGKLHCPCHNGWFDLRTGLPLAGPPRRRLPRVLLEVREGTVYAIGVEDSPT